MKALPFLFAGGLLAFSGSLLELRAESPVIVHEWGTFTCLQDNQGRALGGINVDDEPVPPFVYRSGTIPVVASHGISGGFFGLPPYGLEQEEGGSIPFGDPTVTMRLETPVLYFYPPAGQAPASVPPLQVKVDFHGGLIGQFYPYAWEKGIPTQLTENFTSSLTWKRVRLGSTGRPVQTTDKVWTTPREVSAPLLQVKTPPNSTGIGSQTEHFLFYRGVGHLDSPLTVSTNGPIIQSANDLNEKEGLAIVVKRADNIAKLNAWWLVQIRPDGTCAFRAPHAFSPEERKLLDASNGMITRPGLESDSIGQVSPTFTVTEFGADQLTKLKASMQAALEKEGLYPDEASAMLRTWELSYFKSPGLRFFYIVPTAWVNKVLPLKVSGAPTEITRVMVGRIELITDAQKAILAKLAAGPCPDLEAVRKTARAALDSDKLSKEEVDAFYRGEKPPRYSRWK